MRSAPSRSSLLALLALGACGNGHGVTSAASGQAANSGATGGQLASGGQAANGGATSSGAGSGATGVATAGASGSSAGSGEVQPTAEDAPTEVVPYTASSSIVLNPERGFFASTSLVDAPDLTSLRGTGVTLVHSYVRLDDYRTAELPAALLAKVSAGFEQARQAGLKVILRFAYNFGPYPDSEPDAPKTWVLTHISELKPLLAANADVIAVVQAGFIGAWGEWHSSTNNLTDPATRQEILETLVDAVPASRSVQLRYPPYKRAIYGDALTVQNAFDGSRAARIGHHNDCFVSSDTDVGTYPADQIDFFRDYAGADTAFVPMGGETCAVSAPRSECPSALAEMAKLHFSYINREFQQDVLASWQPCRQEMEKRLGYRLLLKSGTLPKKVKPGGSFTLGLELENQGFAAPFNARPVFLTLRGGSIDSRVQLMKADPRRWLSGASVKARLRLPAKLAPGKYTLGLWLPDAAPTLQERSEYAIQLANEALWDAAKGENTLGAIEVAADAPGVAVEDAPSFAVLAE